MLAVHRNTGDIVWSSHPRAVLTMSGTVYKSILWSIVVPNDGVAIGPVTVANGVVFGTSYGAPYDALLALEATSGKILWQYKANSSIAGGVSVFKGCVYMGEGPTEASKVVVPFNIRGLRVDAFCV
ncbi:unnamed protein product [Sphagnum jensenii]|uniref:Uncharacterized protein n=1 Tax=Sphagnum jensenii TaxID=128206 RepID=A0ABP1AY76_9BRYO